MLGPTIHPHHAVIANIEGVVTVTPTSHEAECYVEGQRIFETTVLQHGKVVRFGHHHAFRFLDPSVDEVRDNIAVVVVHVYRALDELYTALHSVVFINSLSEHNGMTFDV